MPNRIKIKKGVNYHPDKRKLSFMHNSNSFFDNLLGRGRVNKPISFNSEELERLPELVKEYSWDYKDLGRGFEVRRTLFGSVVFRGPDRFVLYRLRALRLSSKEYSTLEGYLKD